VHRADSAAVDSGAASRGFTPSAGGEGTKEGQRRMSGVAVSWH